jgi:ubiquitin-conjugating enzyme E2 S
LKSVSSDGFLPTSFDLPFVVEGTPFVGGCFKLKLVLSQEYPNAPPRGFFLTKIYHPNVADNGDICVNTLKKDWTTDVTLKHIFQVIKCLLIVPFPESSLNCEAGKIVQNDSFSFIIGSRTLKLDRILTPLLSSSIVGKLFMESYEEFARRARIMTEIHALPVISSDQKLSGEDCASSSSSSSESVEKLASKKKMKDAMKKSLKRL